MINGQLLWNCVAGEDLEDPRVWKGAEENYERSKRAGLKGTVKIKVQENGRKFSNYKNETKR